MPDLEARRAELAGISPARLAHLDRGDERGRAWGVVPFLARTAPTWPRSASRAEARLSEDVVDEDVARVHEGAAEIGRGLGLATSEISEEAIAARLMGPPFRPEP